MSQICNDNTKRSKSKGNELGILGISSREFMYGNSAEGLRSRSRKATESWGYVSIFENTLKKLLHLSPKSWCNFTLFREGHSWSIVVT